MRDIWEKASEDLADALKYLLTGNLAGAPFERCNDRMLHVGLSWTGRLCSLPNLLGRLPLPAAVDQRDGHRTPPNGWHRFLLRLDPRAAG